MWAVSGMSVVCSRASVIGEHISLSAAPVVPDQGRLPAINVDEEGARARSSRHDVPRPVIRGSTAKRPACDRNKPSMRMHMQPGSTICGEAPLGWRSRARKQPEPVGGPSKSESVGVRELLSDEVFDLSSSWCRHP